MSKLNFVFDLSVGKLRNSKMKRHSNAEMFQVDKDQEEEVNRRFELAYESDLYFNADWYTVDGEKPNGLDEESESDEENDVGDSNIDMNDG